jgi:hypothetical protein
MDETTPALMAAGPSRLRKKAEIVAKILPIIGVA